MTDKEFIELLKRNLTLEVEYKANWGKPYLIIKLVTIPDKGEIGSVRIDASDLEMHNN